MKPNLKYAHLSWDDVEKSCINMYAAMKSDSYYPDVIIGLLWGGVVPTRIFVDLFATDRLNAHVIYASLYNNIGVAKDKVDLVSHYCAKDLTGKKVLIIDDIWDSGRTMRAALQSLIQYDCIVTAATLVYKNVDAAIAPHYYDKVLSDRGIYIVFPWEKYEFYREISK